METFKWTLRVLLALAIISFFGVLEKAYAEVFVKPYMTKQGRVVGPYIRKSPRTHQPRIFK